MRFLSLAAIVTLSVWLCGAPSPALGEDTPRQFTRLAPLPAPRIVSHTNHWPSDRHVVTHLIDGDPNTDYAAEGKDPNPTVEFDFSKPTRIVAFRHVDRSDPATISQSELIFSDPDGKQIATVPVTHVNQMGGTTLMQLPSPVTAQRVRWRVTGFGPHNFRTTGGREITFFTAGEPEPAPQGLTVEATAIPMLKRDGAKSVQPLKLSIDYPYAEPIEGTVRLSGTEPKPVRLAFGAQTLDLAVPAENTERLLKIQIEAAGRTLASADVPIKPVPKKTIYLLPHSHVDIGYTELQTAIEKKQMANIVKGLELARKTADYPEGARYKWNVEVLWAVESYLKSQPPEKQREFIDAVKKGWIGLDAMYGNELTGLCRPEELLRVFRYATDLYERCGQKIESAMISDVPGYTWGTVSAMAHVGVKYWSIGPNYFDRMGFTIATWENKPFWWVGPNGKDKVLCWIPYQGYAMSHLLRSVPTPPFIAELMTKLDKAQYPYELIYIRWSGYGDNAEPDTKIPDFVKGWNEQYESPRIVISTTAEAFREMERRHGDQIPTFTGDWTPYWEDGAGSSASETAISRNAADRLTQAETLWALLKPAADFPAADFHAAWRNVMLYSEHTWGAHNSVTEPELDFVKDQWKIKQAFAFDAEKQSQALMAGALRTNAPPAPNAIHVFNTTSWTRSDLVTVSRKWSQAGDRVTDSEGKPIPSQRLTTGELAILPSSVPGFASRIYSIAWGEGYSEGTVSASADGLQSDLLSLRLDPNSGAIVEMRAKGSDVNLADTNSIALNDFFFVAGAESKTPLKPGPAKITVKEKGPLIASLLVEADAPGCNKLSREIRLLAGKDYVEIINTIDKKRIDVTAKPGNWAHAGTQNKEGLHFGYAFNVPGGVMRMDIPWATMRPEADQIPGACKNWFTVQRWVDVSNDNYGVTWATLDAPLVEVGAITANLLGSQTNPKVWISKLEPTQTFYSWVMNNHWHTNYRAYQEGVTTFRYAIRPHKGYKPDEAARFSTALSQPLIAVLVTGRPITKPRLQIEGDGVLVTAVKPSDDGKATIVRLFGASGKDTQATLRLSNQKPGTLWLSDTSEKPLKKVAGSIDVPAWGIVTLRAELP